MYGLDINFLSDREERALDSDYGGARIGGAQVNWTPAIIGAGLGLIPLLGVLGFWGFTQQSNTRLAQRQAELEAEVAEQGRVREVLAEAEARAQAAEADARALVTVFDQIKPWSAMMASIRETIPGGVQVQTVQQSEESIDGVTRQNIELRGLALTFDDVNDFVLVLRRSPFLDADNTNLVTAQLIENPETIALPEDAPNGTEVRQPKVVEYTIGSTLTDRPASELLSELESTLAVGLTSRIQTLQDKGAF